MRNMHWRDRWDYEAGREYEAFIKLSEEEMLDRIRNENLGHYFQIWRAIGVIGTFRNAAMVLWGFLQQHPGEFFVLHRYHCAAALFQIIGIPDPDCKHELHHQVQWDHEGEDARQQALQKLRAMVEENLLTAR